MLNVPFPLTVSSCELAPVWDEPVNEPPASTVNLKSLSNWATSVGLACRFLRVTMIDPAVVVRSASAFTGPPPVTAPVGVVKENIPALAGAG